MQYTKQLKVVSTDYFIIILEHHWLTLILFDQLFLNL